jgi:hypothetical protein
LSEEEEEEARIQNLSREFGKRTAGSRVTRLIFIGQRFEVAINWGFLAINWSAQLFRSERIGER